MPNPIKDFPVQPISEYLVNGPIPADELMDLDSLESYLERGIIDSRLAIHFMLEYVSVHGAPEWWKRTVAEFEKEFHEQHRRNMRPLKLNSNLVWNAAYAEVEAGRLPPYPEDATDEQTQEFLSHGMKRVSQVWAVELLLDIQIEEKNNEVFAELADLSAAQQKDKGEIQVKEIIVMNLLNPVTAQITAIYLNSKYTDFSFKVTHYYSEHHHVVTFKDVTKEQLEEIQAYAQGVSDVLKKLIE
jgi:hypothetical protein